MLSSGGGEDLVPQHDTAAFLRQTHGRRAANSACASDTHHLVFQPVHIHDSSGRV
jgi:hypothetical protein